MSILDTLMVGNSAGAETFRDYFFKLLATVWEEGEGFSSKRPFGDSGWEYDLYSSLAAADLVSSSKTVYDEGPDQYVEFDDIDYAAANQLIFEAINEMCYGT